MKQDLVAIASQEGLKHEKLRENDMTCSEECMPIKSWKQRAHTETNQSAPQQI